MSLVMIRATIKEDKIAEAEEAVQKVFSAINDAQPAGVRYASSKTEDGQTYVIMLELNGGTNPLLTIPAFGEFQENLRTYLTAPPTQEKLDVVGSYRLFE